MIKRKGDKWLADIQPGRLSKRHRKLFATKAEALRFEAHIRHKYTEAPDWRPRKKDNRKLSELIQQWYEHHGRELKDGLSRRKKLEKFCLEIGNPVCCKVSKSDYTEWRASERERGISKNSVNKMLAYCKALYQTLITLELYEGENPFNGIKKLKEDEKELTYLVDEEIIRLIESCRASRNKDLTYVVEICLSTGARWSEAQNLDLRSIKNRCVTFEETKSYKKRTVPVGRCLYERLENLKNEGKVGFDNCYKAFVNAVNNSDIQLPNGQLSHVLRHTFASHFIMSGGNIIVLQKTLGHSSLAMTMRYAHLAPDHLETVRTLNPLS